MINNSQENINNAEISVHPEDKKQSDFAESVHQNIDLAAKNSAAISTNPFPSSPFLSKKAFIIIISFFHGLYQIRSMADFMFQKNNLELSPSTTQLISALTFLPWCIKPVFGFLYDKLIIRIKRVTLVIFGAAFFRIITSLYLYFIDTNVYAFILILLITVFSNLAENICCECTLVKMTKKDNLKNPEKKLNHLPIYFGYKSLGALIGTFLGGRIVTIYTIKTTFLITGLLAVCPLIICLLYNEKVKESKSSNRSIREEFNVIKELLFGKKVLEMAIFVFFLNLAPSYDQVTNFYLMEQYQFSEIDLSNLQSCSILCYVAGLVWYSYSLYKIEPKQFYMATNLIFWLANCSFLLLVFGLTETWGIDAKFFCYLNYGFSSLIAELNFMPIIAIWCAVCPTNLEATSITLFTGLMNLSANISTYLGALITWLLGIKKGHFDDFWIVVVIQNWYFIVVILAFIVVGFPDPSDVKTETPTGKQNFEIAVELVD